MSKYYLFTFILWVSCISLFAQSDTLNRKRLDYAKTYFELGGNYTPSFTGKSFANNTLSTFQHPASFSPYLNWGGFHFWGHAEFYVKFPLGQYLLADQEASDYQLTHYVTTGARFLPWAYQDKKIRPYLGLGWSALDFKQVIKPQETSPVLSKDFMLNYELGLLYGYGDFSLRVGLNYLPDNTWNYPVTQTRFEEINTPNVNLKIGVLYALDLSKKTEAKNIDKWNSYDSKFSKPSYNATKSGDFFLGVGPSLSYSLAKSAYNEAQFPYLKSKLASSNYFDLSLGYHFNRIGLFSALSFRNPSFETEAYGTQQSIQKTSLALELNKFVTDYSGFTPYIGINVAYDRLSYSETQDNVVKELNFSQVNPGLTVGWDILPGKTEESLILRTNLRWYPRASFEIDNKKFDFSQLEYNLIQLVYYPGRRKKKTQRN